MMIERKRRLFRVVILWLIETGLKLLRNSATRKKRPTAEQNKALAQLKLSANAILRQALTEGHTCIPLDELALLVCSRHKDVKADEAVFALRQLSQWGNISVRGDIASLPHVALAEETIAQRIQFVGRRSPEINLQIIAGYVDTTGSKLNEEQYSAVRSLANSPISILTGAPGTGKTMTIKALSAIFERAGYQVHLAAPTGRAAARLSEATGNPAQTLHRLLQSHHRHQSLRELIVPAIKEAIIVDESSMIDLFLAKRLLEYCTSRTKLIFVGDVNQLPPVGPGQVFRDLVESGQIHAVELINTFRQSSDSDIPTAARQVKAGATLELPSPGTSQSDCYFIEAKSVIAIQRLVVTAATSSLPKRCGADAHRDIQVLTPMHNGALGTVALNKLIRRSLNKCNAKATPSPEAVASKHDFRPGDRVLQTRNNYDLGVFNGECGFVEEVSTETVAVRFGERRIEYHPASFAELSYGFAITTHRSQGSEYAFVIIPIHESQQPMLARELLYTALTRGKKMVVMIGSRRALDKAINTTRSNRHTGLKTLLSPLTAP